MTFSDRARALAVWAFIDPLPAWCALLGLAVPLVLAWQLPVLPELRIRIAGYFVTLLGVVLVAKGIADTQRLFGRPTIPHRAADWLRRLRPIFSRKRVANATIVLPGLGVSAMVGHAPTVVTESPSMEVRVAALEEKARQIEERITRTENRLRGDLEQVRSQLDAERSTRDQAVASLSSRLESFSAGSLDYEVVGVVWVIAGQALGSFPAEIAGFLGRH